MTGLSILAVGFVLGLRHATDTDHLAAVATLATRQSTLPQALRQGLAWGIGHTLTLFVIGGAVLLLGKSLPAQFEAMLELAVGVMLVFLGADVLRRLFSERAHFHVHRHGPGEQDHLHLHEHAQPQPMKPATGSTAQPTPQFATMSFAPHVAAPHSHPLPPQLPLRALLIGMMHGMAGSAALILLSVQTAGSVAAGLLYILIFGVGSMAGMATLSVLIAVPLRLSAGSMTSLHRGLSILIGLFSCALGAWTVYQIATQL